METETRVVRWIFHGSQKWLPLKAKLSCLWWCILDSNQNPLGTNIVTTYTWTYSLLKTSLQPVARLHLKWVFFGRMNELAMGGVRRLTVLKSFRLVTLYLVSVWVMSFLQRITFFSFLLYQIKIWFSQDNAHYSSFKMFSFAASDVDSQQMNASKECNKP